MIKIYRFKLVFEVGSGKEKPTINVIDLKVNVDHCFKRLKQEEM